MTNYTAFLIKEQLERVEGDEARSNLRMCLDRPEIWQWEPWDKTNFPYQGESESGLDNAINERYWEIAGNLIDLVSDKLASVICFKSEDGYNFHFYIHEGENNA